MERIMIISEPWDFTSSDGDNRIRVKKIDDKKKYSIYKCLSEYKNMSDFLLIQKRDAMGNYNIYQISDYSDVELKNLKLSLIGNFL